MTPKYIKRLKRHDRIARRVITGGGMGIIVSVVGILFLIAHVSLPLFYSTQASYLYTFALPSELEAIAIGADDYQETAFFLDRSGQWHIYQLDSGEHLKTLQSQVPSPGASIQHLESHGLFEYSILWSDGSVSLEKFRFGFHHKGHRRIITHQLQQPYYAPPLETEVAPSKVLIRQDSEEGRTTILYQLDPQQLQLIQEATEEDFFGESETTRHTTPFGDTLPGPIQSIALDQLGTHLYIGTENGYLLHWNLSEAEQVTLEHQVLTTKDKQGITALSFIFGESSILLGAADGSISTWSITPSLQAGESPKLQRLHTLTQHTQPIRQFWPSLQDKSLWSLSDQGLHLDAMTSEKSLLQWDHLSLKQVGRSKRNQVLLTLNEQNQVEVWHIDNPHPEASWKTLFGKVWYESYAEPEYVWQSSSGSDDFEPKLSLVPLLFGSLKGTFYAMIFAVPLALFGAIYTSQFAKESFRRIIKPLVEIMAAMPSVIIGFLAALWLAPFIVGHLISLFLYLICLPISIVLFLVAWSFLRQKPWLKKMERGYEFLLSIPLLIAMAYGLDSLQPFIEAQFFGGNFTQWLYESLSIRYDQRNSIIIAFGLGFMVIPIIFTMTEDALSNVPPSLKAASFALGASRWQTAWRVVLPSASPGIFAGIIIGFGRAIGETMVVLMATGNTPIMDWSPFNGMRTLSANIAVELPEAPIDGSLYRILFLSAVLLFVITFVLNTLAELIRQQLRRRYGQF